MKMRHILWCCLALAPAWTSGQEAKSPARAGQFVLICLGYCQGPDCNRDAMAHIAALRPPGKRGDVRVGISAVFSHFQLPRETLAQHLARFLRQAEEYDLPVVVQFEGEHWRDARPDLWNWCDPSLGGFNPENRQNVEWDGWGPEHALRISWINWGRQVRIKPAQNLMSPRYRDAVHAEMRASIPQVLDWWRRLPAGKKDLFVGIKLGHESSVGVNGFFYPHGNDYADRPEKEDPRRELAAEQLPGRGMAPIGYAAVSTLGLAKSGVLKEEHLAEVVRIHLRDLCRLARDLGVPRERLFTHCGGWAKGERLYASAVNEFSCPGWSFYTHGMNPRGDVTAMSALATSDAPYWGAVEWLPLGAGAQQDWEKAFHNTLAIQRCRYLCVFHWGLIKDSRDATRAISAVLATAGGRSRRTQEKELRP
jgi:hypothetical protein